MKSITILGILFLALLILQKITLLKIRREVRFHIRQCKWYLTEGIESCRTTPLTNRDILVGTVNHFALQSDRLRKNKILEYNLSGYPATAQLIRDIDHIFGRNPGGLNRCSGEGSYVDKNFIYVSDTSNIMGKKPITWWEQQDRVSKWNMYLEQRYTQQILLQRHTFRDMEKSCGYFVKTISEHFHLLIARAEGEWN